MNLQRRNAIIGAFGALAVQQCYASQQSADMLDWSEVYEKQQGDIKTVPEFITFDEAALQGRVASRGSFSPRLDEYGRSAFETAQTMEGWSRSTTPEKIAAILGVYDLPFVDINGKYVPFCAAGISYLTACAYLKSLNKSPTIAAIRNLLSDIDHYHFFPSPSVWDMYYVARGRRHWVDGRPGLNIPKPGWLVVFDWHMNGGADHVGMVKNASSSVLETIEFNTSADNDSNGGKVATRHRKYNDTVKGFIRTDLTTL